MSSRRSQVSSIKKLAYSNADFGLRLRLRPTGASAPEGEPSGSERLRIAELKTKNSMKQSARGIERSEQIKARIKLLGH